jgi:hypothetical protein
LRQTFQSERAESDAFQFFHGMAFGKKHASQNVFLGILQRNFIPEIFRVTARGIRLPHRANGAAGVASQTLQVAHHQPAFNFYVVHLLKIGPVFQHFRGEITIVGQKNQAHRVVVEPPNWINTLRQTL